MGGIDFPKNLEAISKFYVPEGRHDTNSILSTHKYFGATKQNLVAMTTWHWELYIPVLVPQCSSKIP